MSRWGWGTLKLWKFLCEDSCGGWILKMELLHGNPSSRTVVFKGHAETFIEGFLQSGNSYSRTVVFKGHAKTFIEGFLQNGNSSLKNSCWQKVTNYSQSLQCWNILPLQQAAEQAGSDQHLNFASCKHMCAVRKDHSVFGTCLGHVVRL